MSKTRIAGMLSLFVLLLAIAGCGGGDDSTTTTNGNGESPATAEGGDNEGSNEEGSSEEGSSEEGSSEEGSSEEGSSEEGAEEEAVDGSDLTRAEFIKAADAVCDKKNREQATAVQAYGRKQNANPEVMVKKIIFPRIRDNFRALGRMEPPAGDEAAVATIVKTGEKDLQKAEGLSVANLERAANSPFVKSHKLAEKYGFKVCGQY